MRVFDAAKQDAGLTCPKGKYFFADAGYSNSDMTLVPYRGVRYHLREWESVSSRPANKEELFNLRHSSLRNHIERNFGIFKMRWQIFKKQHRYSLKFQAQLVMALTAVDNFINLTGGSSDGVVFGDGDFEEDAGNNFDGAGDVDEQRTVNSMAQRREAIAIEMWRDYQGHLEGLGL